MPPLQGKKGLVTGIANADSIAYGCARALRRQGADLALTYLNDKAAPYVQPLAQELESALLLPLDVEAPDQMAAVFDAIDATWGRLDFAIHALAFAPAADLRGRVTDCSLEGFQRAMHVSCYSFVEMARRAEPLLRGGGTLLTMSFYGADKVVGDYNLMGLVKAALQCSARYLARELGPAGIRVHALSPGPIRTRAAGGLGRFDDLVAESGARTPIGRLATIDDVGELAAFLVSDAARALTGDTLFVDGGRHVMG
jgi:enoyl-[acyl-carrier protein] reductase I